MAFSFRVIGSSIMKCWNNRKIFIIPSSAHCPTCFSDLQIPQWWKICTSVHLLPMWSKIARKILLVQPSSAAVERVFQYSSHCWSFSNEKRCLDLVTLSKFLRIILARMVSTVQMIMLVPCNHYLEAHGWGLGQWSIITFCSMWGSPNSIKWEAYIVHFNG